MTGKRFSMVPLSAANIRELGAQDLRTLIALASHANGDGRAYPSLTRLAAITGIDRRGVCRSIGHLETAGLIRRQRQRLKGQAESWGRTSYELIFGDCEVVVPRPLGGSGSGATGVVVPDTPLNRPIEQKIHTRSARSRERQVDDGATSDFETFWRAYPYRRPNPKDDARAEFEKALKRGVDPAVIILGAQNYRLATENDRTEPRFIPHARKWLHGKQWNDYQDAPEPPKLQVGMN